MKIARGFEYKEGFVNIIRATSLLFVPLVTSLQYVKPFSPPSALCQVSTLVLFLEFYLSSPCVIEKRNILTH